MSTFLLSLDPAEPPTPLTDLSTALTLYNGNLDDTQNILGQTIYFHAKSPESYSASYSLRRETVSINFKHDVGRGSTCWEKTDCYPLWKA